MEKRTCSLIINTSDGTASGKANNYKISLTSSWVKEMGLNPENRQMELCFDGASITITKKLSFSEFPESNRQAGHKLLLVPAILTSFSVPESPPMKLQRNSV